MEKKKQLGVDIDGCVFAIDADINNDEFMDKFIEFIESNGWHFGGGINQIDSNGKKVNTVKAKKTEGWGAE
ncbi:hypothetical protein EV207_10633 [Scopulibacillus darangshiensis]|uniref:Uncharacterized protein n=1 Tax=Scopulibacillus darangshiensis TaxID=442528 RepID=A0A4R2P5S4_9BACL|nr:hypothetical protein [Scopulibacillus darangshiensis]TCP30210.1 hypothetical protein EV207_10633 [Scopulibacillus darangshiensis]